jgi:AraC-like DNA-binding protein
MCLKNIRPFYAPVQPTAERSSDTVVYKELMPATALQDCIYCYWQLNTTAELPVDFRYGVVADGCIDIFVELNKPSDTYVMGFCRNFTSFPLGKNFNYTGIRFLPTMFSQLFGINAKLLRNRYEHAAQIIPAVSEFIGANLHAAQQLQEIKQLFDNYFTPIVVQADFNCDSRLYDAIYLILKNHGSIDIEAGLQTGISTRQLRRLFEWYIGDTAKNFSKVVRFQHLLKNISSAAMLRQNKFFFNAGYYDQAHFIKEFKKLYGLTPSKALGK